MADLTLTQQERDKLDRLLQLSGGTVLGVSDSTLAQPLELPVRDYTGQLELPEPAPVFSAGPSEGLPVRDYTGAEELAEELTENEREKIWKRIGLSGEADISWWDRAKASLGSTPEAQIAILKSQLPSEYEVTRLPKEKGGDVAIRDPAGTWRRLDDPDQINWGDLADWVGELPEIVGATVGGTKGFLAGLALGAPLTPLGMATTGLAVGATTAAAGGATGDAVRQGLAQYFGRERPISGEEITAAGGRSAAGGAVGGAPPVAAQAALRPGGALLRPTPAGARWFDRGWGSETAAKRRPEAEQISRELGIAPTDLPPSVRSESKLVQGVEQFLKESPYSAEFMEQEVTQPFVTGITKALGRTRKKIGGADTGTAARSDIDIGDFEKGLVQSVEQSRKQAGKLMDKAFGTATKLVPDNRRVQMLNLPAYLDEIGITRRLGEEGKFDLLRGAADEPLNALRAAVDEVHNFGDLKELKRLIQLRYSQDAFGNQGRVVYRKLMQDLEHNFDLQSRGGEAATEFKRYLSLAEKNINLNESSAVRKIFGRNPFTVDLEKIDDVANKVFRTKSKVAIQRFKERIGAVGTDEGLEPTTMGDLVWRQMQQLHLDKIIAEATEHPDKLNIAGKTFYNKLFGPSGLGEDVVAGIYGPRVTAELKKMSRLLIDGNVSEQFFKNYSNTGIRNEMSESLKNPVAFLLSWGKNILARQPWKTPMRREFLSEGMTPDVSRSLMQKIGRYTQLPGQLGYRAATEQDSTGAR